MEYDANDLHEFSREYVQLKQERDDLRALEKSKTAELTECRARLTRAMVATKSKSLALNDIGFGVYMAQNYKATCAAEFREMLHAWLEENGLGHIVVPKVDHRILTSTVRECEESGIPIPDFIDTFRELDVKVRKLPRRSS